MFERVLHYFYCVWVMLAIGMVAMGQVHYGIPCLLAAPILRVSFSAVDFWREGDRLYLGMSLGIALVLLYTCFLGIL